MARTSTFPLADRLLDGKLADLLTEWQAEGLSYVDMAFRLRTDHAIVVSPSTVHRWINQPAA